VVVPVIETREALTAELQREASPDLEFLHQVVHSLVFVPFCCVGI
jgi:hypothetical protein